jgi:hypothetical protein
MNLSTIYRVELKPQEREALVVAVRAARLLAAQQYEPAQTLLVEQEEGRWRGTLVKQLDDLLYALAPEADADEAAAG